MTLSISFSESPSLQFDTVIVDIYEDNRLSAHAETIDRDTGGMIKHHLETHPKFKGKAGQTLVLTTGKDSPYLRVILLGLGDPEKIDHKESEIIGGKLFLALRNSAAESAVFTIHKDEARSNIKSADLAAHLSMGCVLRSYKFDKYKTNISDDASSSPEMVLEISGEAAEAAEAVFENLYSEAEGVFYARNLVNEPANTLYPESFAQSIKDELRPLGVEVEVFDEKKLQKMGFEAHMAVGQGSAHQPRLVVMKWAGDKDGNFKNPMSFVGKGITFDTGGVNLKPNGSIEEMKLDMAGAAAVVGLMKTVALRKAGADVLGVVALAENMNSSNAYRPGDIIGSLSGQTIEVSNTDAEGRLVLADSLTYVQKTYNPAFIVDLATLTGAMMIALGFEYCGTFVNDNELWDKMEVASHNSSEKLWRMPLDPAYKKEMDSQIADMKSLGSSGRYAGACAAAGFLERFIEEGTIWSHMDIAGVSWVKADRPTAPKPATGFGVRILNQLIKEYEA